MRAISTVPEMFAIKLCDIDQIVVSLHPKLKAPPSELLTRDKPLIHAGEGYTTPEIFSYEWEP